MNLQVIEVREASIVLDGKPLAGKDLTLILKL
jgi:FKBP-type peptidyl-prolyl cis-trans isomerase 2